MIDNGVVSVPNYGAWEPDGGWVIEGPGVKPDYDVESDPNLWIKGIDPQLDKAVQLLLEEIKKSPRLNTKQPPELDKVKKG
jgi:tricorn protease